MFDDPVPVGLLPTSLGICVVLGFVLPHSFIPLVYFARGHQCFFMCLLTVLGGWQRGAASAGLEWVHDNSVPLFPDILAGLLVGFTLLQPLAFVPVFSQLLPEI